jgi:polynucleotide 5'-kinase involved in rRNA processing
LAPTDLRIIPAHFADQLLCGLADRHGDCLGLGLIEHIDFRLGELSLLSPVPQRRIRMLQFGDLHLSRDGRLCLF